jgi:hypothetical protein
VHAERARVATALAALAADDFSRPGPARMIQEFLLHDLWHAAQIAVARRLSATRAPP